MAARETSGVFTPKSLRIFIASLVLSLLLIALTGVLGLKKVPTPTLWKGQTRFDTQNAYRVARQLAVEFPNRVPWSEMDRKAGNYLKGEFRKLGLEPKVMKFDERIGNKNVTGLENIYAVIPGTELRDEYVVVLAHYDITDTTVQGATDDASGVGIVVELARVFKNGPAPRRNLVFLATDSEEFGAFWGAHNFVEKFPQAKNIVAAISLDFVAPDEQVEISVLTDGLQHGYTPLWLREMALGSVRSVPFATFETLNFVEFVQRSLLIPPSDHGPFLQAGIPSFNYFGKSKDFGFQMGKVHHTPLDNMDHLRMESFTPFGKATETLIRSLDAQGPLLQKADLRESEYLKLTSSHYLDGTASILIHYLWMMPYFVYVLLLVYHLRRYKFADIMHIARTEMKSTGVIFVSIVLGIFAIRLLPELKLIERYEMFPATQKSLILYNPQYGILALVLAVVIGAYFGLRYLLIKKSLRRLQKLEHIEYVPAIRVRHAVQGILLGLVILVSFTKNSYLGSLLLLPPAYLWMLMKNNRLANTRFANTLLFVGGFASAVAVAIAASMIFSVGVIYWYLFLAVAYGLVSVYATIIGAAVITVGIRILRNLIL